MQRPLARTLISAVVVACLAAGSWLWLRMQAEDHLPVDTQAVPDQAIAVNAPEADGGKWARRMSAWRAASDLPSVSKAFQESRRCVLYHAALSAIDSELNDERMDDLSRETLATLESMDSTTRWYLAILDQTKSLCAGSNERETANVYSDVLLKAALMGDEGAETCFVLTGEQIVSESERTAESLAAREERYIEYAPALVQKALERADPYVAAQALYRYIASQPVHPSRLDDLPKANPYLTWQGARLASLIVTPQQRERLEGDLEAFRKQEHLQPDAITKADESAKAIYQRDYADKPVIDLDAQAPCYPGLDLVTPS